ncbi:15553_t:CDS:2, partial [Gigaspora rosea]
IEIISEEDELVFTEVQNLEIESSSKDKSLSPNTSEFTIFQENRQKKLNETRLFKIKNDNLYKIGCSVGILKNYYKANSLEKVIGNDFPELKDIPTTKLSLRVAAKQLDTKFKNLKKETN